MQDNSFSSKVSGTNPYSRSTALENVSTTAYRNEGPVASTTALSSTIIMNAFFDLSNLAEELQKQCGGNMQQLANITRIINLITNALERLKVSVSSLATLNQMQQQIIHSPSSAPNIKQKLVKSCKDKFKKELEKELKEKEEKYKVPTVTTQSISSSAPPPPAPPPPPPPPPPLPPAPFSLRIKVEKKNVSRKSKSLESPAGDKQIDFQNELKAKLEGPSTLRKTKPKGESAEVAKDENAEAENGPTTFIKELKERQMAKSPLRPVTNFEEQIRSPSTENQVKFVLPKLKSVEKPKWCQHENEKLEVKETSSNNVLEDCKQDVSEKGDENKENEVHSPASLGLVKVNEPFFEKVGGEPVSSTPDEEEEDNFENNEQESELVLENVTINGEEDNDEHREALLLEIQGFEKGHLKTVVDKEEAKTDSLNSLESALKNNLDKRRQAWSDEDEDKDCVSVSDCEDEWASSEE